MTEFFKRIITSFVLGLGFWVSFVYFPPIYFSCILIGIFLFILLFEWGHFFSVEQPLFWLLLPLYLVLPFVLLIYMNQHPLYHNLLLELFLVVAGFDTGSYIVGNLVGIHKIVPHISPGKTWEGALGGYVFSTIGLLFLVIYEQSKLIPPWILLSFSLTVCLLAFLGDLFESWLKRCAHIKDSGVILPGHGGFLDRFDGIMFATPFFFFFRVYLSALFG